MQNYKLFILFLFLSQFIVGQEVISKKLKGKVTANYSDLEGIYIVNLKNDTATLSEKDGYFNINASVGDTLMFSAVQFVGLKLKLKKEDFDSELLFVKMEPMINVLDEVKIQQYKNINSVSLGLVSKNQKQYTPAERRLKTASGLDAQIGTNSSVGLDPLFNWISGRTSMLKQALLSERKDFLLVKINNLFEENHFTQVLKIPTDYVKGFQYYIVEDEKFVAALNNKNKTMASFLIGELAVKYLEIIKPE